MRAQSGILRSPAIANTCSLTENQSASRSSSIPSRLAFGYSGDVKHAWIDVYIESVGWVEKVAQFDGNEWKFMDPTFDSAGKDSEAIREYIGDASNYTLQYVY